jgi:hypothetical protein
MRYLIYVLIAGNLFALGLGVMLLVAPQTLVGWVGIGARWFSWRRATRALDIKHDTDAMLMRNPRLLGIVLLISGAVILVRAIAFATKVSANEGGQMLAGFFGSALAPEAGQSLWLSLVSLVLLGAVLAVAVGLLALVRADVLARFSDFSNRWVTARKATQPLARTYRGLDLMVHTHPRLWGAVITLLAIYAAGMLIWFEKLAG